MLSSRTHSSGGSRIRNISPPESSLTNI